ncbi:MAG: HPr kinase/phosphorylase, partial [Ignavibacteria bacterium]
MIKITQKSISRKEHITVSFLFNNSRDMFKLKLYSDDSGFEKKIYEQNLHRPGLALAGFFDLFSFARVQVYGNTEMRFLSQLSEEKKLETLQRIFKFDIPCIILTDNNEPFPLLIELANKNHIPVFGSPFS